MTTTTTPDLVIPEIRPIYGPKNLPPDFKGQIKSASGQRFYVAGPMRGYAKWNFPAFDRGRNFLVAEGHEAISPADMDRARGITEDTTEFNATDFEIAIRMDTAAIMMCSGIYLLRGWEMSTGAKYEHVVAKTLGREILFEKGASQQGVVIARRP